ncbi:MAG: hypothetical protein HOV80_21355 [Polyangiaceae bacterium]|nr:hypothetical protein [Polyangiaceae bacterium]
MKLAAPTLTLSLALTLGIGCSATVIREDGEGTVGDEIAACVDDLGEFETSPSGDCKRYCGAYSCAECGASVADCEARCSEYLVRMADRPDALECLACAAQNVESVVEVFTCEDFSRVEDGVMVVTWNRSACPVCETER